MIVNAVRYSTIFAGLVMITSVQAFIPMTTTNIGGVLGSSKRATTATRLNNDNDRSGGGGIFGAIGDFFNELDAFVDDATSRRLGSGSAFYGKRKSNFYGEKDKNRKSDRDTPDPTEDYQGPAKSGYFQWMQDEETGEMKPVTRLKKQNIERNPNYWDRVFDKDENNK